MQKRRSQSVRQDNVMERHCHWSVSGVAGTGALRAGVRENRPKYDNTRFLEKKGGRRQDEQGVGEEAPEPQDDDGVGERQDGDGGGEEAPEGGGEDEVQDADQEADNPRHDADQDDDDPRHDIQARLRRSPNVIVADTWANRPQRNRTAIDKYQAGTRTATKKPGRGRGQ